MLTPHMSPCTVVKSLYESYSDRQKQNVLPFIVVLQPYFDIAISDRGGINRFPVGYPVRVRGKPEGGACRTLLIIPNPTPEMATPTANPRLFSNHCPTAPTAGTNVPPMPFLHMMTFVKTLS